MSRTIAFTRTKRLGSLLAVAGAALALVACSGDPAPDAAETPGASGASLDGSLTVFAAASLTDTFTELAESFESENPGVEIELTFAGSSSLVTQITEGAPADVFASANEANMTKLTDEGLIAPDAPVTFATNVLTIAVPPGNPAGVTSLADLTNPDISTVICAPQVPCGAATTTVADAAGVDIPAVSEESSVTDVLGKVTSGQADAGLVYVTDVFGAGDAVEGIEFAESDNAVNVYPIAPVDGTDEVELADAFIEYVTGEVGTEVLGAAGFGSPAP